MSGCDGGAQSAMSFSQVIGQERPISILRRALFTQRVSHAYLFVGPPNVGKSLVGREFAKAANCEINTEFASAESVEPCDQCLSCRRIADDAHPDVRVIRPLARVQAEDEEGTREAAVIEGSMISTEQVADLVTEVGMKATQARRKVFMVLSAEAMNPTAANRLLKTLEEPPGTTTLILTTHNPGGLLPTIVSRCQSLTFRAAPLHEAEAALRARYPEADLGTLRSVVALSGGRVGWAIRLLSRPQVLRLRTELLNLAASLPGRQWVEGMAVGEKLLEAAENWWLATEDPELAEKALRASRDRVLRTRMSDVLDVLATWFRDLALLTAGGDPGLVINADRLTELQGLSKLRNAARCRRACEDIETTRRELRGNANLRLAAEVLAFKLISASR